MKFVDYYRLFGVTPQATDAEIRRGYLRLAKKYHPDVGGSDERMRFINEAYGSLQGLARYDYDKRYKAHYLARQGGYTATGVGSRQTTQDAQADDRDIDVYDTSWDAPRARRWSFDFVAKAASASAFVLVVAGFLVSLAVAVKKGESAQVTAVNAMDQGTSSPIDKVAPPQYVPTTHTTSTPASTGSANSTGQTVAPASERGNLCHSTQASHPTGQARCQLSDD